MEGVIKATKIEATLLDDDVKNFLQKMGCSEDNEYKMWSKIQKQISKKMNDVNY